MQKTRDFGQWSMLIETRFIRRHDRRIPIPRTHSTRTQLLHFKRIRADSRVMCSGAFSTATTSVAHTSRHAEHDPETKRTHVETSNWWRQLFGTVHAPSCITTWMGVAGLCICNKTTSDEQFVAIPLGVHPWPAHWSPWNTVASQHVHIVCLRVHFSTAVFVHARTHACMHAGSSAPRPGSAGSHRLTLVAPHTCWGSGRRLHPPAGARHAPGAVAHAVACLAIAKVRQERHLQVRWPGAAIAPSAPSLLLPRAIPVPAAPPTPSLSFPPPSLESLRPNFKEGESESMPAPCHSPLSDSSECRGRARCRRGGEAGGGMSMSVAFVAEALTGVRAIRAIKRGKCEARGTLAAVRPNVSGDGGRHVQRPPCAECVQGLVRRRGS
eukprot:363049-Chlamydomonas_euryale.AAC.9